jgi:hypothetical protein
MPDGHLLVSDIKLFFMSTNAFPAFCAQEKQYFFAGLESEIFVDPKADLTIEDISSKPFENKFKPNHKKHFGFGLSTNTNWFRFKLSDVAPPYRKNPEKIQFYFDYASFDDIKIYIPVIQNGNLSRIIRKGGISHGIERDLKGFVFPVFDLPDKTLADEYIYVRISGPFTANFQLVLTDKSRFETLKLRITLFLAFVFGVMGAMIFYNIILFFMLRDKNYLFYVLYLVCMTTYQATIAGIVKLVSLPVADFMTTHVVILCFTAIASHLIFAYFFLNVVRTASVLVNLYRAVWVFCIFGAGFSLAAHVYQANFIAYLSGLFVPFLFLTTVIVTYRNGHWVSRYYLIAMAMLLIDIDFFKSVNDTYGHQKGDEVLRVLGDIIKEALRKSDFPCRIGGEEFAVLTPGTNISEALVVGERIRKEFASRPFKSFSDKTFFPP